MNGSMIIKIYTRWHPYLAKFTFNMQTIQNNASEKGPSSSSNTLPLSKSKFHTKQRCNSTPGYDNPSIQDFFPKTKIKISSEGTHIIRLYHSIMTSYPSEAIQTNYWKVYHAMFLYSTLAVSGVSMSMHNPLWSVEIFCKKQKECFRWLWREFRLLEKE